MTCFQIYSAEFLSGTNSKLWLRGIDSNRTVYFTVDIMFNLRNNNVCVLI